MIFQRMNEAELLSLLRRKLTRLGGSPGLVFMGGDSCSEGCGFKSQHCILDGLFALIRCKNCIVCLKDEIK